MEIWTTYADTLNKMQTDSKIEHSHYDSIDENLTQLLLYQNVPSSFITWQQFLKIVQLCMYYEPYITDGTIAAA